MARAFRPFRQASRSRHDDSLAPGTGDDPLLALRAGDPGPFEAFVRLHARTFVAFFAQRGAGLARAEDLAQELFLRLFQSVAGYRPQGRFLPYAFRLAHNLWIDDRRRLAARPRLHPLAPDDPARPEPTALAAEPGAGLARAEDEERFARLLATLPDGQRRVFELAVLGELSYDEIGDLLAVPVGTVKSRMFHAVRRLRRLWKQGEAVASVRERA